MNLLLASTISYLLTHPLVPVDRWQDFTHSRMEACGCPTADAYLIVFPSEPTPTALLKTTSGKKISSVQPPFYPGLLRHPSISRTENCKELERLFREGYILAFPDVRSKEAGELLPQPTGR